jgi:hypothetical protein
MRNLYKNILLLMCLSIITFFANAQTGLVGIEVETYYISTAADNTAHGVPTGSKTYRVYANLAPGFGLQSIYGTQWPDGEIDSLVFFSTQNFWNAADGDNLANSIANSLLAANANIIDSWLTFGSGGGTRRGIRKVDDTDGGIATTLTNSGGAMGSPLTTHDGRFNTGNAVAAATVGADMTMSPFDALYNATVGNRFSTASLSNGFVLSGNGTVATGALPGNNRVLLGQFTTAGEFGYNINIQIGNGTIVEQWVADSPRQDGSAPQYTMPSLKLVPNTPPTVAITTPASNVSVVAGTTVNIEATANDTPPGSITQVEFFNGTTSLGVDNTSPYQYSFTATTSITITAVATDNEGATTTSAPRVITVTADPAPVVTSFTASPVSPVVAGTSVTLNATATDNGNVVSAQFLDGTTPIGSLIAGAGPFSTMWTATPAGAHTLAVVVTDNLGNTSSQTLAFTVSSDPSPVVTSFTTSLSSPRLIGTTITLNAAATDNGSVVSAQFKDGTTNIGALQSGAGPFSVSWTPTIDGSRTLSVTVTDNQGNTGSATLAFTITPSDAYEIRRDTALCNDETICVPIQTLQPVDNVIGYDLELSYPKSKVIPTGVIRKSADLAPINLVETSYKIVNTTGTTGKMLLSIYFNSNAPISSKFSNAAANKDLVCVEFQKRPAFLPNDQVFFDIDTLEESYITGVFPKQSRGNNFVTYRDSTLNSKLEFWADRSALFNVSATNPTLIYGANAACVKAPNPVQPNANGEFTHFLNDNELFLNIERDIQGGAGIPLATDPSVQSVINGFDALLVRKVLLEDASFVPTVYQMIAMDVNLDGQISAGDASQINQRSVKQIGEFRQNWNYSASGVSNGNLSKDWMFINDLTVLNNNDGRYSISSIYPKWDQTGYNKDHVPPVSFCNPTPVSDWTRCAVIDEDIYVGILLGDVNGNYQNLVAGTTSLRADERVIVDITKAVYNNDNTIKIPVTFSASTDVNAIDFALDYNDANLSYKSVSSLNEDLKAYAYENQNDNTLRVTSNGINVLSEGQSIMMLSFDLKNTNTISSKDFNGVEAFINGESVSLTVRDKNQVSGEGYVSIFPNPTTHLLNVEVAENAKAQLFDLSGKAVSIELDLTSFGTNSINVQNILPGLYTLKVYNSNFTSTKKVIITK